MNHWMFIIPANRKGFFPELWEVCRNLKVCAAGFPPQRLSKLKHGYNRFKKQADRISVGDKVIAYLRNRYIGAIGTVKAPFNYEKWEPTVKDNRYGWNFGRRLEVEWIILPDPNQVIRIPKHFPMKRRPTLSLLSQQEYTRFVRIARDTNNRRPLQEFLAK